MRRILISTAIIALATAPAFAVSKNKFAEDMALPAGASVKVDVVLSPDMIHRADNLPEKLSDRSGSRGLNNGFGGNGFYGMRELDNLRGDMADEMITDLSKAGYAVTVAGAYTLRVTIDDARPNRPTMGQLSKQPSLSFRSIARGGARMTSELIDPAGNVVGTSQYGWYDSFLDDYPKGTWSEAKRAFSRYASKTAKTIGN
ncbi:hypothetical protein [Robiginitomaculum antarcticum]|uniref:hypothetical protein n=1 Tax=Robiginitomaculum antarcticum TaxID=437507 RepID=UPI0003A71845|nr:hypothetical protein [Robiginitomaculum antarcticum]